MSARYTPGAAPICLVFEKLGFLLAWMLVFDDLGAHSISHVSSKANGYVGQVDGYHKALIGTLASPSTNILAMCLLGKPGWWCVPGP